MLYVEKGIRVHIMVERKLREVQCQAAPKRHPVVVIKLGVYSALPALAGTSDAGPAVNT